MTYRFDPHPPPGLPLEGGGVSSGRCGPRRRQMGAAAVEFALIALFVFLPLLLGIVELGRLFYVVNTTQEVTRRAARAQVVAWMDQTSKVQHAAVFRAPGAETVTLPGGVEVSSADVRLTFYQSYADAVADTNRVTSGSPESNLVNCIKGVEPCIRYVRATLVSASGDPISYSPMIGWFGSLLQVPLPASTVVMPAESLGIL